MQLEYVLFTSKWFKLLTSINDFKYCIVHSIIEARVSVLFITVLLLILLV